jgi:hypothetical protein
VCEACTSSACPEGQANRASTETTPPIPNQAKAPLIFRLDLSQECLTTTPAAEALIASALSRLLYQAVRCLSAQCQAPRGCAG